MRLEELVIPMKIEDGIKGAMIGITAVVTAFVGVATLAVNASMKWAEAQDNLSETLGITQKEAAGLNMIAKKYGVSQTALDTATKKFSKSVVGESKSFKKLGISLYDSNGVLKSSKVLLQEATKALGNMEDGVEKTAISMDLFGKSGTELHDILPVIGSDLDSAGESAEKMGLFINPEIFEKFGRSIEGVKLTLTGLANIFSQSILPPLTKIIDAFDDWLQSPWIQDGIRGISETLGVLLDDVAIGLTTGNWTKLWEDLDSLWDRIKIKLDAMLVNATDWVNANLTGYINDFINAITGADSSGNTDPSKFIGLGKAIIEAILAADWYKIPERLQQEFKDFKLDINTGFAELEGWQQFLLVVSGILIAIYAIGKGILTIGVFIIGVAENWAKVALAFDAVKQTVLLIATVLGGTILTFLGNVVLTTTTWGAALVAAVGGAATMVGLLALAWIAVIAYVIINWEKLGKNLEMVIWGVGYFFKTTFKDAIDWVMDKFLDFSDWLNKLLNNIPGVSIGVDTSATQTTGGRASGGPVIAGQSYNVAEFSRPEVFTPSSSGRIDAKGDSPVAIFDLDYNKLAQVLAFELAKVAG